MRKIRIEGGAVVLVPNAEIRQREREKSSKASPNNRDIMERLDVICEALDITFAEVDPVPEGNVGEAREAGEKGE